MMFLSTFTSQSIKLNGSDDTPFDSIIDKVSPLFFLFVVFVVEKLLKYSPLLSIFQLSTLNFNSSRAMALMDPVLNTEDIDYPPLPLLPSVHRRTGTNLNPHTSSPPQPASPNLSDAQARPQSSALRSGPNSKGKSPLRRVSFSVGEQEAKSGSGRSFFSSLAICFVASYNYQIQLSISSDSSCRVWIRKVSSSLFGRKFHCLL